MAEAGREQGRDPPRFVYVTRFGSHQCGSVLQLGGRGARDPGRPAGRRGAAVGAQGGGQSLPCSEPRAPEAPSAARAGLIQKILAKKFDYPVPLNETSKIIKKKKKASVWNSVYKVISRMLEENEKYRLRLKCQQLSSKNSDYAR